MFVLKIKINPLTPALFAILTAMGSVKIYITAYLVILIHETAHLCAALLIGLKPESITFAPFGVNLRLKNKMVYSLADEIILYAAGPLVNAVFAVLALYIKNIELYRINTTLFVLNLLPIVPFDGGMILMRILSNKYGFGFAKRLLYTISWVLGTAFFILACISVVNGIINISLFIIAIFLIGNLLTAKSLYDADFINAVLNKNKTSNKVRMAIIDKIHPTIDAVKSISPSYTTIAVVLDEEGNISSILSEHELIGQIDMLDE